MMVWMRQHNTYGISSYEILGEDGVVHHLSRVTVKIIHHWPGIYLDTRCWGHMIWDAARLERTGGKEVLIRKHEERWKGHEWDASEWV